MFFVIIYRLTVTVKKIKIEKTPKKFKKNHAQ